MEASVQDQLSRLSKKAACQLTNQLELHGIWLGEVRKKTWRAEGCIARSWREKDISLRFLVLFFEIRKHERKAAHDDDFYERKNITKKTIKEFYPSWQVHQRG